MGSNRLRSCCLIGAFSAVLSIGRVGPASAAALDDSKAGRLLRGQPLTLKLASGEKLAAVFLAFSAMSETEYAPRYNAWRDTISGVAVPPRLGDSVRVQRHGVSPPVSGEFRGFGLQSTVLHSAARGTVQVPWREIASVEGPDGRKLDGKRFEQMALDGRLPRLTRMIVAMTPDTISQPLDDITAGMTPASIARLVKSRPRDRVILADGREVRVLEVKWLPEREYDRRFAAWHDSIGALRKLPARGDTVLVERRQGPASALWGSLYGFGPGSVLVAPFAVVGVVEIPHTEIVALRFGGGSALSGTELATLEPSASFPRPTLVRIAYPAESTSVPLDDVTSTILGPRPGMPTGVRVIGKAAAIALAFLIVRESVRIR